MQGPVPADWGTSPDIKLAA
jgi:hypothetical protein